MSADASGSTPDSAMPNKQHAKRPHDKPLSLYPMSEDDVLRKLVDAGPLPGKPRTKPKHHHGGAVTTPKSKPTKGTHSGPRQKK